MLPHKLLITEQPAGDGVAVGSAVAVAVAVGVAVAVAVEVGVAVCVGVGALDCTQYLPPVLKTLALLLVPPQTIISLPVHTAACQ
jgi:hypothetical protein